MGARTGSGRAPRGAVRVHAIFCSSFRRGRKTGCCTCDAIWSLGLPGVTLPVQLTYQVGRPVEMPSLPEATRADVEEHHARYMDSLRELFEKPKREAGYGDRHLQFL